MKILISLNKTTLTPSQHIALIQKELNTWLKKNKSEQKDKEVARLKNKLVYWKRKSGDAPKGFNYSAKAKAEYKSLSYFVQEGSKVGEVLGLNLFLDLLDDEVEASIPKLKTNKKWIKIKAKYTPIAKTLEARIKLVKNKRLNEELSQSIESVWYEGNDAYEDVEGVVENLPNIYKVQVAAVEELLEELDSKKSKKSK